MPITGLENATNWKSESVKGGELDGAYVIANQLDLIEKQQGQTWHRLRLFYRSAGLSAG